MNLQKDKVNSHLLSCPQVLLSFHTAIEFHSVEFIKSVTDKMISILKKNKNPIKYFSYIDEKCRINILSFYGALPNFSLISRNVGSHG